MKFQIILLVLAVIATCSSSEKVKGRRSNIRNDDLSGYEKLKPSTARFFHKKGGGGQSQPTIILLQTPAATTGGGGTSPTYTVSFTGDVTTTPADATRGFMDRYENDDDDDFVDDDEEIVRRNKNQSKKLKLKKLNGKKYVKSRHT